MTESIIQTIDELFGRLSVGDQQVLISMPYRAGLYVSFSDISGGWQAQEKELETLTNILRQYSEDYCKTEFAQKVLMESLRARQQWPAWSQQIDTVPREAKDMMAILQESFPDKQLNGLKEVLFDIALSVAMAFRENADDAGDLPQAPPRTSWLQDILGLLSKPAQSSGFLAHMNISDHERTALMRLSKALDYTPV